jgi:hypothetical protein
LPNFFFFLRVRLLLILILLLLIFMGLIFFIPSFLTILIIFFSWLDFLFLLLYFFQFNHIFALFLRNWLLCLFFDRLLRGGRIGSRIVSLLFGFTQSSNLLLLCNLNVFNSLLLLFIAVNVFGPEGTHRLLK